MRGYGAVFIDELLAAFLAGGERTLIGFVESTFACLPLPGGGFEWLVEGRAIHDAQSLAAPRGQRQTCTSRVQGFPIPPSSTSTAPSRGPRG